MSKRIVLMMVALAAVSAGTAFAFELKVMSFNVRYGTARDGENSWPQRKELLVSTIERYDPDILGTQECLEMQAEYIAESLPAYRWVGIGREKNGRGEMTALFYKKENLIPVESGNFWLSETPEVPGSVSWDSSLTRITTWVRFYHARSRSFFYAFNTHFDHRGAEARAQSAALLAQRIADLDPALPAVLTGDFNATAEKARPWKTLTTQGLTDAWLSAAERQGPAITFGRFGPPEPDGNNRIDWVLYRGPVTVAHCETVVYNEGGRYPSDHFPVFARLTLSE